MRKRMRGMAAAIHLLIALFLATPAVLAADEVSVSLHQALELAVQQNPEILAQRTRTEVEAAKAEGVRRTAWPRLSLSTGWSRTDTPSMVFAQKLNSGEFTQDDFAIDRLNDPDALSHLTTSLAAEVPVDVFRKVKARAEAQDSIERASGAVFDEGVQDLRLRVVEAYRRAALAQRVVDVAERALAGARSREADVQLRVTEGSALEADLLRIRARRRQRDAELAERRADGEIARAMLSRTLGAASGVSYVAVELPTSPPPLEGDGASWGARALAGRPTVRAARERVSGLTSSVRAEERASWPDLAAWGQVQDDRNSAGSNQSGAFGVVLRWSVFDPTRGRRVAAASAETRVAELEARAAADQVQLEAETAWRRAWAARERYAAAAGGAEEGREALRVVQERRQQGMATLTDELETEAASLQAELEELRAATEASTADAALLRAAGAL
jgi:outer membrane protein